MERTSIQHKLGRVRPPRVNIVYEVETGGATVLRELPFVMGILGDFSGQPVEPLPRLADRKFVDLNPDNFDQVLASMRPHLAFSVPSTMSDDPTATRLQVDLTFRSLDDFSPDAVARQVEPLRALLEARTKLADLRSNLQGNDNLESALQSALNGSAKREQLRAELGGDGGSDG